MQSTRCIESGCPPPQIQTASPGRRLGGWALDLAIAALLLGFGWLLWLVVVASRGQTPGKQLLGMYVTRADGSRAGAWYMLLHEIPATGLLFGGVLFVLVDLAQGSVGSLWLAVVLWCCGASGILIVSNFWARITSTYVAHSPGGFSPFTDAELRMRGEQLAAVAAESLSGAPNVGLAYNEHLR